MKLDISVENWRVYEWKDGSKYHIDKPHFLYIKEGATGHRVVDCSGITHWVPLENLMCIRWHAPEENVSF